MRKIGHIALSSFTLAATALFFASPKDGPSGQQADARAVTVATGNIERPFIVSADPTDIEWP